MEIIVYLYLNNKILVTKIYIRERGLIEMRNIEGYVCIAISKYRGVIFGKNMGEGQIGNFDNFGTNGLIPFTRLKRTRTARKEIRKKSGFKTVSIVHIKIDIAETEEEAISLQESKSLIVVSKIWDGKLVRLIGRFRKGCSRYPLYGSLLAENGMKPITSFEYATYVASEEHRQAESPATIAEIKIRRIANVKRGKRKCR
jgi:hypothetical protein